VSRVRARAELVEGELLPSMPEVAFIVYCMMKGRVQEVQLLLERELRFCDKIDTIWN